MPKKNIPSYRKQKTKSGDLAFVELGGTRYYLGKWKSQESRREYVRLLAEFDAKKGYIPDASDQLKVKELLASYLLYAEEYYSQNGNPTVEFSKIKSTVKYTNDLYGDTIVSEFGPMRLKAIREKMIKDGYTRGVKIVTHHSFSRTHINQTMAVIRRIFKWGVENELVPADVLHGLQAVAGLRRGRSSAKETSRVKPVDECHVNLIEPFASRHVWGMIQLQLLTGMRPGEVCIMRSCDIDMSGKVWQYVPTEHKNKYRDQERIVSIGPKAQEVINPFLKRDVEAYLFSPAEATKERYAKSKVHRRKNQKSSNLKTDRKIGDHYDTASYRRAIYYACDLADIDKFSPHQLRHTAGTRFRREFGIEEARVLLGQKTMIAAEIYSEIDREKSRQAMLSIG